MSSALDYWPFDYTRYAEEILPALSLASVGQMSRLQQLIHIGKQRNLSFRSPWNLSRGTPYSEPPSADKFFALMEEDPYFACDMDNYTWEIVERLISFLPGHHFGEIFKLGAELHLALVYAFCSAPMPGGIAHWPLPIGGGEDESVWRWRDYFERDESWREVWEPFYRQPPTAIAQHIAIPYEDAYPRGLNPFGEASKRVILNGFLTPDETLRLQRELPLRRKPFLQCFGEEFIGEYLMSQWEQQISPPITDYAERKRQYHREYDLFNWSNWWEDGKVIAKVEWSEIDPEEAEKTHMRHWEAVWRSEEELMRRIAHAVSRGWGMLMYYQPGG